MIKRRTVILGLTSLPALSLAGGALAHVFGQEATAMLEGDTLETSEGDLVIHPVSHASVVLGWGEHVLYVDPVGGAELYADLPPPTAILITHEHGDHYDAPTLEAIGADVPIVTNRAVYDMLPEGLKANASALANGETGEITGIPLEAIPAYNVTEDRLQYHPQGRDNGYVLTLGDKRVYIAGDTEDTPEMRSLTDIALAFLPMNLPFTMTGDQAADAVSAFAPGIVYPYHYDPAEVETFTAAVGDTAEVRMGNWYPEGAA